MSRELLQPTDERAAFEAWLNFDEDQMQMLAGRNESGDYLHATIAIQWEAWQAGARAVLAAQPAPVPESFQLRVSPWMQACFGEAISRDTVERNHRFLEESLELVQACGCTQSEAHQLVDYVFGRPTGEPAQEVGGVMVTLAALCLAQGLDMHEAGDTELARIWTKVEQIRAKQAAKPKHSPLPAAPVPVPPGWKLVPVEPTPEMVNAGSRTVSYRAGPYAISENAYRAMIAASPEKP